MKAFQLLERLSAPKTSETISVYDLIARIQFNPNQEKIQQLHTLQKGTPEYEELKAKLPCIKPHGTFDGYCDTEHFRTFSGFIYFDVDDLTVTRERLMTLYGYHIAICGHSVGGRGLFFMVRVNQPAKVTPQNFLSVQNRVLSTYFPELNIDQDAKGVNRSFIIPYDPTLYVNLNTGIDINWNTQDETTSSPTIEKSINRGTKRENGENTFTDTFLDIKEVLPHIVWQTRIHVDEWPGDYLLHEYDSYKLFVPKEIPDGCKRKAFPRMVNALLFNNSNLTLQQVLSFISYVNQHYTGGQPMKRSEMIYKVTREYNRIKEGGEFRGVKKKYVITNPKLDREARQRAGAKGVGEYKRLRSQRMIQDAVEKLRREEKKVTQNAVAEILGGKLSLPTIKRHWHILTEKESGISSDTKTKRESVNTSTDTSMKSVKPEMDAYETYMANKKYDAPTQSPKQYLRRYKLPDTHTLLRSKAYTFDDRMEWLLANLNDLEDRELKGLVRQLKTNMLEEFIEAVEALENVYS